MARFPTSLLEGKAGRVCGLPAGCTQYIMRQVRSQSL